MTPRRATRTAPPRRRAAADDALPPRTLGAILSDLRPEILSAVSAPKGLDAQIGPPSLYDPLDPHCLHPGAVVLAVGVSGRPRDALPLLEEAASAEVAAVVLKLEGTAPPELVEASARTGVALLAAPPAIDWGQLYTLLRVAGGPATNAGEEVAGVPMGDLFTLANAIATMVGGAVTIEDPQSKVLAYSSSDQPIDEARRQVILGRQVPEVWIRRLREDGIFQRLWGTEDVVRYDPGEGFLSRLAVAIRAGGEILGSIWAIEGDERLSPEAEAAMKEAAGIAALHLVRHRTTEDLERRRRGELLRAILEGQVPADAAASLGVDPDTGATVVALRWEPEPDTESGRAAGSGPSGSAASGSAESVALTERAAGLVAVYCESFHRQAALATIGGTIYVLIPEVRQRERDRLLKLVADLIDRAGATLHVRIRAGIGSTVPSLDEAVRSRREADQVIRVLAAGPAERSMAPIEDVRPATILLALRDHAARDPSLHSGPVELLVRHDAQKGTSYVDTLRAYLAAFGYIPAAAEMVNVHSNTFRYRLRRLIELSDLDLEDPAARLVAELQLYFLSGLPATARPRPDLAPEDDGKGSGRRRPSPRRRPFPGETATA